MAENPISSDSLTINFADLMNIPVADRALLAQQSPYFAAQLTTSLTPIELAKAFPDYYRRELPDISNFITSTIQGKLSKAGRGYDQTGGGDGGTTPSYYQGEVKLGAATPGGTTQAPATKPVPPSVVDRVMKAAGIVEATGQKGVTSAIKSSDGQKIISTADVSLSPQERSFLDTLAIGNPNQQGYWESPGYNTIVGGKKFENFVDHPRVFGLGNSSAAGRYQFTKTTWDLVVKKYNRENPNNPITDFSPVNQDRAALYLAIDDYKRRTGGRDLIEDLNNPPENFGNLLKTGLGGIGTNTTWQILQKKTAFEIAEAYKENLKKNTDYVEQEAAAAVEDIKGPSALAVSPDLQEFIDSDPDIKAKFGANTKLAAQLQKAVDDGKITIDKMKTIIAEAKTSAEAIRDISDASKSPFEGNGASASGFYENLRQQYPDKIDANSDIWNQVDPELAKAKNSIVDADTGLVGRDALLAADASAKVLRHNNYVPRIASGGDNHSKNHGSGRDANYSIDIAASVVNDQGKVVPINLGSGVDEQIKNDMATAAHFASIGASGGNRIGYPDQSSPHSMHIQQDPVRPSAYWGYSETAKAMGIDSSKLATLTATEEGKRFLAEREAIERLSPEQKTEYFNKITGFVPKKVEAAQQDIVPPKQLPSKPTDDIPAPTAQQAPDIVPPETDKKPEELVSPVQGQSTPEVPVATFRTGGSPDVQDDEDLTAVGSDGKPAFKFNSGEGLYVKPEADEYADDKIEELSDKINKIDEMYQKNAGAENTRKPSLPDKLQPEQDSTWRKRVASASVSPGSQSRAFRRSKFRDEGFHWGRGSPNSITN